MTLPQHRPTRLSGALALLAAGIALVMSLQGVFVAFAVAAGGGLAVAAGLVRGSRGWLAVGAIGLFAGLVLASLSGTATIPVLVGTVATLVAWDSGEHAIGLGEQLGRQADTTRQEVVHAGASGTVGAVGIGLALTIAHVEFGAVPLSAFLVGLLASIVCIAALRT